MINDTTQSLDEIAEIMTLAYTRHFLQRKKWKRGKHFDSMKAAVEELLQNGYRIEKVEADV